MSPTNDIYLVDTSVWINFFKGIETLSSKFLHDNISDVLIATCPTIVQETLQGVISDKQKKLIESYLNDTWQLDNDSYTVAREAAELYRDLRKKGITIRKPNDCAIAIYAIKNNVKLLCDDRDFKFIADNSNLKIF